MQQKKKSIVQLILHAYALRFRIIIFSITVFLVASFVFLGLYFQNPLNALSQLYLNIGASFLTGVVFSLILPIFLAEPMALDGVYKDSNIQLLYDNVYQGLGRVWLNEDTFNEDFNFKDYLTNSQLKEYVFVGVSLSRFFATFGHIVESVYCKENQSVWRPCYFFIGDPESDYIKAHMSSNYGRKDVIIDINQSISRFHEIRKSIATAKGCDVETVPLYLYLTKTQVRFGLYHFSNSRSIITLYRYGSRSYFNPRFEVLHSQPNSVHPTPLGSWVNNYIIDLKKEQGLNVS